MQKRSENINPAICLPGIFPATFKNMLPVRSLIILTILIFTIFSDVYAITLYSYQTGDWDNADTWTTDPGGTTLTGSQVPAAGDAVYILSSRTVTLTSDVTTTGLTIVINSGGILALDSYQFTNTVDLLAGQGILRLTSANFPVVTTNSFVNSAGGTTEYRNFTGALTQDTYNHLKIIKSDENSASYTVTIGSDLTVNGDFHITRTQGTGTITTTIGNNTTVRTITISGDFKVSSGGILNTGNFNAIHNISLSGDLYNYGSIDLSNSAQYAAATNGAASFTFSGASDNSLHCAGTTDFYRFILDKGTDRTYILTVTSTDASYFRLLGPVSSTGGDWSTLPLILQNGTLKLRSAVNIPVLGRDTEAGDIREFHIPGTAGLWIDGANVATSDDEGGWRGMTVYGLFRISSGTFTNQNNTGGITYFGNITQPGYLLIEGGTVYTTQVKQADVNGRVTYHQTGGSLRITGYSDSRGQSAVFALPTEDFVFNMSGGSIYIAGVNTTATNGIDIRVGASNYSVTGGNVTVVRPSGADDQTNFEIYSTIPFYNLILKDTSAAGTQLNYILQHDLSVLNDFTLQERTLNAVNFNVSVGGDFIIASGATYTPGTNTTIFNGTGDQTFTGNGTITSGFNKLKIDKPSGTISLSGTPASFTVRDSLQIHQGTLDDGGKTINAEGHLYVAGIHTGTGKIVLNGSGSQTLNFEIFGTPSLGNVELDNASGASLHNNGTIESFTFTDGMMDLVQYRLTVKTTPIAGFSDTRYFQTNGIASNGGLRLAVDASTLTTGNSLVFPIGVSGKYTPSTIIGGSSPGTGTGYVTFVPVNSVHPSENPSGRHLNYYWRCSASGMPAISNVYYQCYNNIGTDWETGVNRAYTLISGTTGWNIGNNGTANQPNVTLNGVPNSNGFISADITAGNNGAFNNVTAYYSIASGAFNSNSVWSNESHTGPVATHAPSNASDIIYIGGDAATSRNDSIWVTAGFSASSITINGSYTGDDHMPVLNIQNNGGSINVDVIKGGGKFTTTSAVIPSADYGDFTSSSTAVFNYHGATFTLGTTVTSYPNLLITATAANRIKTLPNTNVVVNRNLILSTDATGNTLRYNGTGGNLTVYGDVKMRNSSRLQLDGTTARNLVLYGDINFRYLNSDDSNTLGVNSGTAAHQIKFYGDSIIMGQSSISLTNSIMTVYDPGTAVVTDRTGGSGTITLSRLVISKDVPADTVKINHPLVLSGSTNGSVKALELSTGRLELSNSNIDITLSSGGADFSIPQTAALVVQDGSVVRVTGSNTGISLDGLLRAEDNARIHLGDGSTSDNRYIEYSASGNAVIELAGNSELLVNSQIRRSLFQTSGILKYRQYDNSSAVVYGRGADVTRAKLEIENTGSAFTMSGGTLTIVRGGGITFGDLYLRPESGSATGGTIYLGTQNVGFQTLNVDANIALNNLTLNGTGAANTLEVMVNPLILNGDLTISNTNSYVTTNNINVSVKGDFINNGTYTPGTNTTTLNGDLQSIEGTTSTHFYNLVVNPSTSVTLANDITVDNTLTINSGTFSTEIHDVNAKANVVNNALHTSDGSSGGILLNGTALHILSGTGTYGRLELDNSSGARLQSSISVNEDLLLTSGVLDINQYLLSLGSNSDIVGSGFSAAKMIKPDGVLSNVGIRKSFGAGPAAFTFPLGVTGKYTPAELTIIDNTSAGSIRVNVINDRHPAVTDPDNVLQYYWEVESSGISDFEGNVQLHYADADVMGLESEYVAARLIVPPGTDWSKAAPGASTDNVDESLNTISFDFPAGTSSLGGEYTAGTDEAIPDEVPVYTSNSDGEWDDVNIWTPVAPAGGPNGFIVIIRTEDSVSTNGNKRFAYRTTINGTLDVGSSYGHNLGNVNGTGKLYLSGPVLPAGRFTSFLSCSGGTLEYGGNTDYTIIADRIDTVRNLFFTGTGIRTLPDKDLVVCELLQIDGPTLNNDDFDRKITLFGGIERVNTGAFISGDGPGATISFKGTAPQEMGGAAGNFTGTNAFNNLEIDNGYGLTLNGPLELNGNLLLTDGVITTTSACLLSMVEWNTIVVPSAGSSESFVNGPMSKDIFAGDDFNFPTGKGSRYGVTGLLDAGQGAWEAEYFNTGYASSDVTAPLTEVSSTEYWHIAGPAGMQAYVKLRWDAQSDVTPLTTQNGIGDIRIAEYNTGTSSWVAKSTSASGDDYDGTALTTVKMDLDEHDYTLGSVSTLKPRAGFLSTADACTGDDLFVVFTTMAAPYVFTYSIDGGADQPVTTSSNPYTINTSVAGRYRLTSFTGGVVDTNSVMVYESPTASISSSDGDNTICTGESVTFTAGGGTNYNFYVNGISVQNGSSATYVSSSLTDGSIIYVVVTNASGCADYSEDIAMTVHAGPVPVIDGSVITCTGDIETYTTESGMTNYSWTVIGGIISAGGTSTDHSVTVTWETTGTQSVFVNYENSYGCSAVDDTELNVEVYRRPETGPAYHIPDNHYE
ncbi:MAG: hypothetical protein JXB19_00580 [Bacteroidales bacterium]|nr:hypothetical protein [Bacteroidales bacterium]